MVRARVLMFILMTIVGGLLLVSGLSVEAAAIIGPGDWPSDSQWFAGLDPYWNPITDPQDQPQGFRDVVVDPLGGAAYYWYYDDSKLFFRIVLRGDPLNQQNTRLRSEGWGVFIESTGDTQADYSIALFGTGSGNTIATRYFDGSGFVATDWSYNSSTNAVPVGDYIYVLDGYGRRRHVIHPDGDVYYLDFYIPLEWLSRQDGGTPPVPVTEDTPVRFAVGTGTQGSNFNSDLAGQTGSIDLAGFYETAPALTIGGTAGYGALFDSRTDQEILHSGIWDVLEIVTVNGYGWPHEPPPDYEGVDYYNDGELNVRFLDPEGALVWQGVVQVNSVGQIPLENPADTWEIPLTAISGLYTIQVENPLQAGFFVTKDTFAVQGLPFATSTKTVNKATTLRNEILTYTIEIKNTSDTPINLWVTDAIPTGIEYVVGSIALDGVSIDDTAGFPLASSYEVIVNQKNDIVITYQVKVESGLANGDEISNAVAISDGTYSVLLMAETLVQAPVLQVEKSASTLTVAPGAEVVFTTTITNSGMAAAQNLTIVDVVPTWTTFLEATGPTGSSLEFQDSSGQWHADEVGITVVAIRWNGLSLAEFISDPKPSLDLTLVVRVN